MEFVYINHIRRLIDDIESKENASMKQAVDLLVNAIVNKNSVYSFGASHAGIISEELFYRAGGLVVINPIFGRELMLDNSPITMTSKMERLEGYGSNLLAKTAMTVGDILIVHSVSGRNPVTIEIALEAKKRGAKVIGITNITYSKSVSSRHSSNLNLYEICDVVIDNHGDLGDACVSVEGMGQKVGPTSTVIGAVIVNCIISATTQELIIRGVNIPPVFYSANIDGGDALNNQIFEEYKDVIHYNYK